MATSSSSSRARGAARPWRRLHLQAEGDVVERVRCGNSAKLWNIIAVPRAAAGRSRDVAVSSRMSPSLDRSWPAIMRRVVVLPQPEGPSRQQ